MLKLTKTLRLFKTYYSPNYQFKGFGSVEQLNETEKYKFRHVCKFFQQVSDEPARNKKEILLRNFLKEYRNLDDREEFVRCLKVISCQIFPTNDYTELNVAENTLFSALGTLTGENELWLKKKFTEAGDLSLIASEYLPKESSDSSGDSALSIQEVVDSLNKLPLELGGGSQGKKEEILHTLLKKCQTQDELMFLIRIIQKRLRAGLSHKTIIKVLNSLEKEDENMKGFLRDVEQQVFGFQISSDSDTIYLGLPLPLMLSRAIGFLHEIPKVLKKFGTQVWVEFKYDGERSQIHFENGEVRLFSRSLENQSDKYGSYLSQIKEYLEELNISSCILDCEIVAFDHQREKVLSFSDLQTHSRKAQVDDQDSTTESKRANVNIVFIVFDIIYLNGDNLSKKSQRTRSELLRTSLLDKDIFRVAKGQELDTSNSNFETDLQNLYARSLKEGFEGLMIKSLGENTYYDMKGRTQWLKLKRDITGKTVLDTLDLVPVAAYYGEGKRKGLFGAYLMSVYNPNKETYEAVCKIGTGFTDENLKKFTERLKPTTTETKPPELKGTKVLRPDIWLNPSTVWEIECDRLTLSPIYPAGKGRLKTNMDRGISLRFPRFIRERDDKKLDDSTTVDQLVQMYNSMNPAENENNGDENEN